MASNRTQKEDVNDVWNQVPASMPAASTSMEPLIISEEHLEHFMPPPAPTFMGRLWEKSKRDPFVPIGFAATVACLTAGVYSMGTGDKKRQQLLMRGRVAAQAFTLCAFGYGIYRFSTQGISHKQHSREQEKKQQEHQDKYA